MNTIKLVLIAASGLFGAMLAGPVLQAQSTPPTTGTPDPAALAPGAGVETVQARCAACHPASMITAKHYDAQTWRNVVDQMIAKGAQVGDDEYEVIVAYLASHYGPAQP